jgi:uncharacterized protein YndB with AHSA1/START domain
MIKTIINIDAPRPQVFRVLTDFVRYQQWLPGCENSKVLSTAGHVTETEITVRTMKTMTMGLRFEAHPEQLLEFRMTSGKDIKAYTGSYRLMDAADGRGTVVIAELQIDAGPLAPRFLVDRMAKKAVDDTGAALRKYLQTLPVEAPTARRRPAFQPGAPLKPAKRILRVVKTPSGHQVWYMGQTYRVKV